MSNGTAICGMEQNECSKMMCQCDKTFLETIKLLTFVTGCPKIDPGCWSKLKKKYPFDLNEIQINCQFAFYLCIDIYSNYQGLSWEFETEGADHYLVNPQNSRV